MAKIVASNLTKWKTVRLFVVIQQSWNRPKF